tara:strand:+ start:58 stop:954 length:897 start_codon:yes stop_codon:yes gene_type:complete
LIKRLKKEQKINYQEIDHFSPLVRRLTAPNPSPFTLHGTGTFIIGNKEICIIDPGPKLDTHIDNILNSINRKLITHILITHTHKDHSPAAQELKKATNAKTYGFGPYPINNYVDKYEEGHDLDFKPDIFLKDGDIIRGSDWTIKSLHTPGHTSNHMCFGLEEEKLLFTGDHVMGWATTVIIPPDGNMSDYINSLKKLLLLDYSKYFPTHGSPITEPQKYVRALIAHRKMREKQILEELKTKKLFVKEMVPKFYSSTKRQLWKAAEKSVLATLIGLEEKGYVRCIENTKTDSKWSLIGK